jgi:hypothetical protein
LNPLPLWEVHAKASTWSAALQPAALEPLARLKALTWLKALAWKALPAAKTALEALHLLSTWPPNPWLRTGSKWIRVVSSGKIDADNDVVRMQRRRCRKEHQDCKHPAFHAREPPRLSSGVCDGIKSY